MAILPDDPFALNKEVSIEDEPGLTWYIDKTTNRINGEVDGYDAVRQAVEIILRTDRYAWQIFSPYSGVDYRNLIGQDPGYVAMELQRRIKDALSMDERVTGIEKFKFAIKGDALSVSFVVRTVYGSIEEDLEVQIA